LTVVIVNYNSWPDVARLATALADSPEVAGGRCEVVVVDNASDGPVPPELDRPRAGVRLILRGDNGGFAAGVNAGWRASRGRWLLLVNPDVVAGPDLLGQVLARVGRLEARGEKAPGVVGFGLRNPDGSRQGSVGAEPGLARAFVEPFLPRSRRKYKVGWGARPGPVPWVTGACALVDARLLDELGGMDEDFFLYHEEVALCRSARDRGRAVEYDPSIEVVHLRPLQGRSVSPLLRVITRHSKLLYFLKHLPRWQFLALARLVAAEAGMRGLWAWLRGRAEERRAWRAVGRLAGEMPRGEVIRGVAVRELAEAAVAGEVGISTHSPTGAIRARAGRPARERAAVGRDDR
jgi:GT2 family glycosyltransferase